MNKKILALIVVIVLVLLIVFISLGNKDNDNTNVENSDIVQEEIGENEASGNFQNVTLILNEETNDTAEILFSAERFAVEEYFLTEPQNSVDFVDKMNGNDYSVSVTNIPGYTIEDFYNRLVNNAKRNTGADDFNATEMIDVSYGGIGFKKFTASWSKGYEYNSKETGELVSGVSNEEETAIFAELQSGVFLIYEGPDDEEILKNLFVEITK